MLFKRQSKDVVEHPQRQETPVSRGALSLMKVFGSYDAASEQSG
jgi:hypothetical protein